MFLGIDLGTTNVKVLLVDRDGRIAARGSAPVELFHVGEAGVEQDLDGIWRSALSAVRGAGEGRDLSEVRAVGVSSQGGALQALDQDGRPRGRVVSWMDGRGERCSRRITERLGGDWFARHTGHGRAGLAVGQILRLRQRGDPPAAIGFVGDLVVERLCGRRAHDATSLSIALLYNPGLRRADPALLEELGLRRGQLPDLLPARRPAGTLTPRAAELTGLPEGIPVSPAVHDQYAAALGAGAVEAGDVMFGAGTAWVLLAAVPRLAAPVVPSAFVCTHVVEDLYGQMLSLVNGGAAVEWARRTFGVGDSESEHLDELLGVVEPGAAGVRCRPLLAPGGGAGLPSGIRGRLDGLRLSHTPRHLLRAVVEGLACELARHLRFLSAADLRPERLVMCGGAAAGRVTPQIVADATGLPLECTEESETGALGAAVIARGLAGPKSPLADLATRMAPPTRRLAPGENARLYAELLEEYLDHLPHRRESENR
ncbi:MAG: xylulokinase [Planctomycetota bacterium]